MFGVLKTPRRIILSGTPIQNDLSEFHAMVKKSESSKRVSDIGFNGCLGRFLQSWTIGFDRIFQFDRL
jgi:SNF2 family DNA or RNA helicase